MTPLQLEKRVRFVAGILILNLSVALCGENAIDPAALQFFENKIRPLLAENCYSCHSVNAKKLKGKLYLDSREGVARGGENGAVIVPGEPDKSRLILAVKYKLKDTEMPPDGPLKPEEIAALEQWIKMGAPDPRSSDVKLPALNAKTIDIETGKKWWAYQPLASVTPPKVAGEKWCRTPLDRFVLAKLEEKKVAPNAELDKRRLIRRAYFDLLGLPPEPEKIDAFVQNNAPDAYEKLIDELLASPHFGEKWGRHWLDLARFAESHGFEQDYDRKYAFHYRDFVIDALNQDMPYDQFVKWQIAGDELAPQNVMAMKATGFLAAGVHATQITANQAEKERYDELDDLAQTIGTSLLGTSFGCARCHDHKFDPIPTKDYYRLIATFTKTVRSEVELDMDRENTIKAKAAFEKAHQPYVDALKKYEAEKLSLNLAAWEKSDTVKELRSKPAWEVLDITEWKSEGGATFEKQPDGSILASGKNAKFDSFTFTTHSTLKNITGVRLEALPDKSMVKNGPGRAGNGNFALTNFTLRIAPQNKKEIEPYNIPLKNAKADFEQKGLPVAAAIDTDSKSAWAIDPQFGKKHTATFETEKEIGFDGGTTMVFRLYFQNNDGHSMGRVRLSASNMPPPLSLDGEGIPSRIASILDTPAEKRDDKQRATLLDWYKRIDPEWTKLNKEMEAHAATAPKGKMEMVQISSEGTPAVRLHTQGPDFYDKTFFLKRGDLNQKMDEANPGFPQVLTRAASEARWESKQPPGAKTLGYRSALAKWITDPEKGAGHLLARVMVNRLWARLLGRGIVSTPSDFGAQGGKPVDPELLDFLAHELIDSGWKLKPMLKQIMLSAAYRQDSKLDPKKAEADPENKLFWRRRSGRLEAEQIRDAMLSISGMLDTRMFGAGTLNESDRRRSVYLTVKRSQLIPMMAVFDAPNATQAVGQRPSTTIAPQALELLNNKNVREYAKAFAKRVAPTEATPFDDCAKRAYLLALGRAPDETELRESVSFLEELSKQTSRAQALVDFCQAVMGLNEFVYVE